MSNFNRLRNVLEGRLGRESTRPAFDVFPLLERFRPTFRPRRTTLAPPGASHTSAKGRQFMINSLYHDLGVCVYAGASASQLEQIGNLLKTITANGGSSVDLNAAFKSPGKLSHHSHSKWVKYRVQTEDRHIDPGWGRDIGRLSLEGIHELCMKASSKWMDETTRAVQKQLPELGVKRYLITDVYLRSPRSIKGIMHPTISGHRRLDVDAHCHLYQGEHTKSLHVRLYTVGTGSLVGVSHMRVEFATSEDGYSLLLPADRLEALNQAPSLPLTKYDEVKKATDLVFYLEQKTWAGQVDKWDPTEDLIHKAVKIRYVSEEGQKV